MKRDKKVDDVSAKEAETIRDHEVLRSVQRALLGRYPARKHDAGFAVVRTDDIYAPGLIIDDRERQILEAKATIAASPDNENFL